MRALVKVGESEIDGGDEMDTMEDPTLFTFILRTGELPLKEEKGREFAMIHRLCSVPE